MKEDRAAATRDAGPRIVVDLNDHVIEGVGAPQAVARPIRFELDRPVVAPVGRVFAPPVQRPNRPYRQPSAWPGQAVGAPPKSNQVETTRGGRAISLALIGLDSSAAERHRNPPGPSRQPALSAVAGPRADVEDCECGSTHIVLIGRLSPHRYGAKGLAGACAFPADCSTCRKRGTRHQPLRLFHGDGAQDSDCGR